MYSCYQTLVHKETKKLVALHPKNNNSVWNYEMDRFIDEKGRVFKDNIKNYTHIEDDFGRPLVGANREKNKYVDVTLKKYVGLTEKQKNNNRVKALNSWYKKLLWQMGQKNTISSPFSNNGYSYRLEEYFFKRIKAKPIAKFIEKQITENCSREYFFSYKGKKWYFCNPWGLVRVESFGFE